MRNYRARWYQPQMGRFASVDDIQQEFDALSRITAINHAHLNKTVHQEWDAAGNRTSLSVDVITSSAATYDWDSRNRLTAIHRAAMGDVAFTNNALRQKTWRGSRAAKRLALLGITVDKLGEPQRWPRNVLLYILVFAVCGWLATSACYWTDFRVHIPLCQYKSIESPLVTLLRGGHSVPSDTPRRRVGLYLSFANEHDANEATRELIETGVDARASLLTETTGKNLWTCNVQATMAPTVQSLHSFAANAARAMAHHHGSLGGYWAD